MADEQLTAIIIKGKVHRLTVIPDDEPCLCKECSLQELCDRLDEHILCDFIGNYRGHSMFKCDDKREEFVEQEGLLSSFKREYRDFKLSKMTRQKIFALLIKANRRRKSTERKAYKLRDKIRRINDDAMTAIGSRQRTIEEQWEVMRELQRRGLVTADALEQVLWDVMKIKRPINNH